MYAEPSAVVAPAESSLARQWARRVISFLEKYYLVLCLALVAITCVRIVSTYNALSLTIDEPVHLAAGIEYLTNGGYSVDVEHPPLARVAGALGPYLAGARPFPWPSTILITWPTSTGSQLFEVPAGDVAGTPAKPTH